MTDEEHPDPWDPESYPRQFGENSPLATLSRQDGYEAQWRLIAEHVVGGGTAESAPRPNITKHESRVLRPVIEGIAQARRNAIGLIREDLYDAAGILATLDSEATARQADEEAHETALEPGDVKRPDNWETARVHTTITRLFTEQEVHDVAGELYQPELIERRLMSLHGPAQALGHSAFHLGVDLDGEYRVDLINAATNEPGPGVMVLRLLWGAEAAIAGAIECGRLTSRYSWGGFGPPGAETEARGDLEDLAWSPGITLLETAAGESAWCTASRLSGDDFIVFLAVDAQRKPVGAILDTTGIANYYWLDEDEELQSSVWPVGAREFDPSKDTPGVNPNQGVTRS